MEPPACSICKHKHWGSQPHVWSDGKIERGLKEAVAVARGESQPARVTMVSIPAAELAALKARAALANAGPASPPKRDRAAYMRDYRAKRAAQP